MPRENPAPPSASTTTSAPAEAIAVADNWPQKMKDVEKVSSSITNDETTNCQQLYTQWCKKSQEEMQKKKDAVEADLRHCDLKSVDYRKYILYYIVASKVWQDKWTIK